MCGRFTLALSPEEIAQLLALDEALDAELGLRPSWNVAPGREIVTAVQETPAAPRVPRACTWGLVPAWSKDPDAARRPINARAETAAQKPSFREAFRRRRCLIPADGFYEWQRTGARKRPWIFRAADAPGFCMAGLWETWTPPAGAPLHTCTILTTAANALMRPVHDRMPVILAPDDHARWLTASPEAAAGLRDLLRPFPAERMEAWPVGTLVNSPRNDVPECTAPAEDRRGQMDLF